MKKNLMTSADFLQMIVAPADVILINAYVQMAQIHPNDND